MLEITDGSHGFEEACEKRIAIFAQDLDAPMLPHIEDGHRWDVLFKSQYAGKSVVYRYEFVEHEGVRREIRTVLFSDPDDLQADLYMNSDEFRNQSGKVIKVRY